jgi:predicted nucleic acid-binding Zn ribbon protein
MSYPLEDPRNPWAYLFFTDERCPKCGEPVRPTDKYCPNCGYQLRQKPQKNNNTELTGKGLAALYIISVILGIPTSLIFVFNIIIGFNWSLFIFWTLTFGAAIGFVALLFVVIFAAIIKKLVNKCKKHQNSLPKD